MEFAHDSVVVDGGGSDLYSMNTMPMLWYDENVPTDVLPLEVLMS